MKRLFTMVTLTILAGVAYGATYPFGSASEYATAAAKAHPGDTMLQTSNCFLQSDTNVPPGVVLDLGGYKVTAPSPTTDRPQGFRLFRISGDNTTIQNGTIDGASWGIFTGVSCDGLTLRNLTFTNARSAAMKISPNSGANGTVVNNILIEDCKVASTGHPTTLLDFGPGIIGALTVRRVDITGPPVDPNYNNTACDGLAVEDGRGPILLEDVHVKGSPGDGIDCKNTADLRMNDCTVEDINRNGIKVWCYHAPENGADTATATAVLTNVKVSGCGLEALCPQAGDVTVQNSSFSNAGVIATMGNGVVNGAKIHLKSSSFTRLGTGSSAMILSDGGDGKPTLPDPARVDFNGCSFVPVNASSLFLVKLGSPMSNLSVADAKAGKWPANFTNCTISGGTVVEPPPIVTPPPSSDLEKLQAAVKALSDRVDALVASTTAANAAQAARWSALAAALDPR